MSFPNIFLFLISFQFFGIVYLIDVNVESHIILAIFTIILVLFFILGIGTANNLFKLSYQKEISNFRSKTQITYLSGSQKLLFILLFLISSIICIVYYKAVGGNIFFSYFKLSSQIENFQNLAYQIKELRIHSYTTSLSDTYFAPGYVNQFKNMILPIITSMIIFYYLIFRKKSYLIVAFIASIITIYFLIGTAQRAPLFWAFFIFLTIYLSKFIKINRIPFSSILIVIIAFLFLFGFISFMQGRGIEEGSILENLDVLFFSFFNRIIKANQLSAIVGFDYIYNKPIVWGREWFEGILGILPHKYGSNLASEIFETFYGSQRGTSPISIVGSIYHNFGFLGLITIPLIYGFFCQWLFIRLIRGRKEVFRIVSFFFAGIAFSSWVYGDPSYILRQGFIVAIGIYLLYRISKNFEARRLRNVCR